MAHAATAELTMCATAFSEAVRIVHSDQQHDPLRTNRADRRGGIPFTTSDAPTPPTARRRATSRIRKRDRRIHTLPQRMVSAVIILPFCETIVFGPIINRNESLAITTKSSSPVFQS